MSLDHGNRAINFCSIKCHFVRSKFWLTNTFIQSITVTFSEYQCWYKKSRVLYLKINNVALRLRSKTMPIPTKNRIKSEKVSLSFLLKKVSEINLKDSKVNRREKRKFVNNNQTKAALSIFFGTILQCYNQSQDMTSSNSMFLSLPSLDSVSESVSTSTRVSTRLHFSFVLYLPRFFGLFGGLWYP